MPPPVANSKLPPASLGIKNTHITRNPGATLNELYRWEHEQGAKLPPDLHAFYASCNGLLYRWTAADLEDEEQEQVTRGKIEINPLGQLQRVFGYETNAGAAGAEEERRDELRLNLDSKVFAMEPVDCGASVNWGRFGGLDR